MAKQDSAEEDGFGLLIRDVSRLFRKRFERKSSGLGLTHAQWSVLMHLLHHEGTKQAALAEMMDIEPITLVGLIDRLERSGWVERRHDPNDRRVRLLFLTKQVRPILRKMNAIKAEMSEEAFAGLSPQHQDQLMHMLERVRKNLGRIESYS